MRKGKAYEIAGLGEIVHAYLPLRWEDEQAGLGHPCAEYVRLTDELVWNWRTGEVLRSSPVGSMRYHTPQGKCERELHVHRWLLTGAIGHNGRAEEVCADV